MVITKEDKTEQELTSFLGIFTKFILPLYYSFTAHNAGPGILNYDSSSSKNK